MVIVLIALSLLNVELMLIAIAIAPVLMVIAYRYSRISHPILKEVQQRVAEVTTQAEENVRRRASGQGVRPGAARDHPLPRRSERIFRQGIRAARLGPLRAGDVVPAQPAIAGVLLVGGHQVPSRAI